MNSFSHLMESAAELRAHGESFALVTVIKSMAPASARPGDKALVTAAGRFHGWIGGGCAQPAVLRAVQLCLADGRARQVRITPDQEGEQVLGDVLAFGMHCHSGGALELFVDPVGLSTELVVLGQSPVAEALARIAPHIGFSVTWLADLEQETGAGRVLPTARCAEIAPGSYAVVASQGQHDIRQLKLALNLQARHVAFVASRRKAQMVKEALLEAGFEAAMVAAIEAPAGCPIHAQTPQEIALSILAGLVARSREAAPAPAPEPTPEPVSAPAPQAACCGSATRTEPAHPAGHGHGPCCHD